jgi:hypothetical protein
LAAHLAVVHLPPEQPVPCGWPQLVYEAQKYKTVVPHVIDKYILLCINVEQTVGAFDFTTVCHLVFTHMGIIRCYNAMLVNKSVRPLFYLWQSYKQGAVVADQQKFIYELCHLIAIVFEQFLLKLAADFAGQNAQSSAQLVDQLQINLPLDELIDVLEQCYQELLTANDQLHEQQQSSWGKKFKILLTVAVTVILIRSWFTGSQSAVVDTATSDSARAVVP